LKEYKLVEIPEEYFNSSEVHDMVVERVGEPRPFPLPDPDWEDNVTPEAERKAYQKEWIAQGIVVKKWRDSASREFKRIRKEIVSIPSLSDRVNSTMQSLSIDGWKLINMYGVPYTSGGGSNSPALAYGQSVASITPTNTTVTHFLLFERDNN
jgi:hypothetical protein